MQVVQAGLAFRTRSPLPELVGRLSQLLRLPLAEVPAADATAFDIRRDGDVMVQRFGDVLFVCNEGLAARVLAGRRASTAHRLLGEPELMLAYRHDDASASYGYAVFENGEHRRTRLQWHRPHGVPSLVERGAPLPFERRWLASPFFFEPGSGGRAQGEKMHYQGAREVVVPERRLTGRLLQDALESSFRVCPWSTLMTPTYRFLRACEPDGAAQVAASPPAAGRPRRWWKLF